MYSNTLIYWNLPKTRPYYCAPASFTFLFFPENNAIFCVLWNINLVYVLMVYLVVLWCHVCVSLQWPRSFLAIGYVIIILSQSQKTTDSFSFLSLSRNILNSVTLSLVDQRVICSLAISWYHQVSQSHKTLEIIYDAEISWI